jgi:PAS domain S-box-containing protein
MVALIFVALIAVGLPILLMSGRLLFSGSGGFSFAAWLHVDAALVTGALLGIIFASFIYLFTTWFAMRDRSQVYLMLMMLCLMVHMATGAAYLGPASVQHVFVPFLHTASLLLFYLFSALFTLLYLEFDAIRAPARYVLYFVMAFLALGLVAAAVDVTYTTKMLPYVGLGALFLLVAASVNALVMRIGGAVAHFMAFYVVFLGTLCDVSMTWENANLAGAASDVRPIAYALSSMFFAMVISSQFARRQENKERELAISNERFRMAALGSNEGLYDLDFLRKASYFSDRFRRIFGVNLSPQKEPLKIWMGMIHPDDKWRVKRALVAFMKDRGRNTLTLDCRLNRPDKRTVWMSATGVAVRDEKGQVVRLIGSVGDVTEKKRAEMRLRASEARFRSITDAHPVPVLIATLRDGEIVFASHGTEAAMKATMQSLMGARLDTYFEDPAFIHGLLREVQSAGQVDLKEAVLKRGDGSLFPAAISARLIPYERRACAVLGLYDISERKAAEARVKEAEDSLQQSEKLAALGGLLAGVAHELNNPLSVIVGQAALLKESTPQESKVTQRADKIRTAGERCSRIVRSFLALARRKPSERKPMDINSVIEDSLELIAFQLRTDNVELKRKLDVSAPLAMADSDQMVQVITNLVINAKQALGDKQPPKIIEVETWHREAQNGQEATIFVAVTDNGTGVPKEIAKRIFEPFFTTKAAGSGTGVGLSLCHNIVETHGGRIWVEDTPGGGARFVFTLPAGVREVASVNIEAIVDTAPSKVKPMRILVVDDEVELGQTLADILAPDGHQVMLAENGKRALEALKERDFDLIISDLRMPVMDGPTMYRTLEKTTPRYLERIIFVTGDTLSIPVREFLTSYALDVIEKPYSPEEVRRALVRHQRITKKSSASKGEESHAAGGTP